MKILHGDDVSASREALYRLLTEAKLADKEVIELNGKSATLTDVMQALETQSLFGSDRLVLIEHLLSGQQNARKKDIITYIQKNDSDELLIWEGQAVRLGKGWPKGVGQEFTLPQELFVWLDGLRPGAGTQSLKLYQSLAQTQSSEMLMVLLSKRLRQLWLCKSGKLDVLESVERQRDWQIRKLQKQANGFGEQQLSGWLDALVEYDAARKSGDAVRPLDMQMELWMADI